MANSLRLHEVHLRADITPVERSFFFFFIKPCFHLSLKERKDEGLDKQPDVQSAEEGQKSLVVPPRKNKHSSKTKEDPLQREQSTEEPSSVDDETTESVQLQVEAKLPVDTDAVVKSSDVVEPAADNPALMEKVSQEKSTPVPSRRKSKTLAPSAEADQKAAQVADKSKGSVTKLVPTRRKSKTVGPTTGLQDPGVVDSKRQADVPNDSESKDLEISPQQANRLVEDSVGVTEGQIEAPGTNQLVLPAEEPPKETTEEQSETVAAAAEGSKILPPRRKSKAAETPLKEKAKLSPALRKSKTPTKSPQLATKGAKEVSKTSDRQKSVEDTEAAVSKDTKLIPTKRKAKNGNGGAAELESKNSQETEGGAASVTEQEGTTTETSIIKESPLLATARKSKSTKASPELPSKKDKDAVKKPGKPLKPNETSTVEEPKASPSGKRSKPSPETRKSSEKSKTTEGEKSVITPPKRKLSVKPSSDAPTTEPPKSKDSPGGRKADPTKAKVKTAVETSVAEKDKVSPAMRKSKGVKTLPATKSSGDNSKDQESSSTSEMVTTKVEAETDKVSAANSESEHLEGSSASTSEVLCAPEVTNTTDVTDIQPSSSAAPVIKPTEDSDDPAMQQAEEAVSEEPEVRPASHEDVTTDEGLKSIEPAGADQVLAEKEQDAPKPPSTSQSTDLMTQDSLTEVLAEEHKLSQDQKQSIEESVTLPQVPVEEVNPDLRSEVQTPSADLSKEPENPTEVLGGQDQSLIPEAMTMDTDLIKEDNEVPPGDLSSNDQSPEVTQEQPSSIEDELPKTEEHPDEEPAKPSPRHSDSLETCVEPPAIQAVKAKEEEVGETLQQVVTTEAAGETKAPISPSEKLDAECAVGKVTTLSEEEKHGDLFLSEETSEELGSAGVSTQCEMKESEDIPEEDDATQSVTELERTQPRPPTEPSDSQTLAEYIHKVCDGAEQLPQRYLVLDIPQMEFTQTYGIKSALQEPDRGGDLMISGSKCEVAASEKQEGPQSESHDLEESQPEIRIVQLDVEIGLEVENRTAAENVDLAPPSSAAEGAPVDEDTSAAGETSEKDEGKVTGVEEISTDNQDSAGVRPSSDSNGSPLEEEKMLMVEISSSDSIASESQAGEFGSKQGETQDRDVQEENPALIVTVTQSDEPIRDVAGETNNFPVDEAAKETIVIVQDTSTGSGLQGVEQDLAGPTGALEHVEETEFIEINIYEQDVAQGSKPPEMLNVEEVIAQCDSEVPESETAQSEGPQTVGEKLNQETLSSRTESRETKSTESLEEKEEMTSLLEQTETVVFLETQHVPLETATSAPSGEALQRTRSPKVRYLPFSIA